MPAVIAARGHYAGRRFVEFLTANIRNPHAIRLAGGVLDAPVNPPPTRKAYYRATTGFLDWCDQARLGLLDIEPVHVAAWVEGLARDFRRRASSRPWPPAQLFDWLVVGQVWRSIRSPVRGPKYVVKIGKTPVLGAPEARQLDSINTKTVVGLRDRALIGLLVFTFARIARRSA